MALLALMAKPKGLAADDEEAPPSEKSEGGSEDKLFRLAIQAIKDGDEDAAVEALRGAVEACVKKSEAGEYSENETGQPMTSKYQPPGG